MKPKVEVIWQSMKCAAIWQWQFKIITAFYRKPIKNQNTNRMKQNRTLRKTKPIYNTLMCASFKIFVCNLQWTIFRHNLPESNKKKKQTNKQTTYTLCQIHEIKHWERNGVHDWHMNHRKTALIDYRCDARQRITIKSSSNRITRDLLRPLTNSTRHFNRPFDFCTICVHIQLSHDLSRTKRN